MSGKSTGQKGRIFASGGVKIRPLTFGLLSLALFLRHFRKVATLLKAVKNLCAFKSLAVGNRWLLECGGA